MEKRYSREIEEKWQKIWEEKGIYKFKEGREKRYIIDSPPPFTSGELHMGHVLSYSYIDFAARYKRMRGYDVLFPQGWDTQGFPTEVKVEKKFGKLPREQFIEKCKEWTEECIKKMKMQMKKLGFSQDWRYEYRTMDREYHKIVQETLVKQYREGLIYRKEFPSLYCPRCESAIAKAETEEVERDSVLYYLSFECEGKEYLIATTRPELLPACVAVMFHPDDERYKELEGKKMKTPLGKEVEIIADKDVEKEFGTGLVMVCTFGDKQDVEWVYRHNLEIIKAIDKKGRLLLEPVKGLSIEEARKRIIEILEKEGKVKKKEKIRQVVKVHDRCKTPVEFFLSYQWFFKIKDKEIAKRIKELAREIKWFPPFGIHYLLDWLDNIDWDWVISRQRYFGTPLPFYYCENCNYTEEADELPFYPEKAKEKICKRCGAKMKPETDVADCWVDSSITPLIVASYGTEKFDKYYPVDLRPQGVEIVRTWAFYTILRCGLLTGKPPFKEILLNGNVLAPDGRKMSKSLGNVISPQELWEKYPVDAIRQWAALSGAFAKDRPFSYEDLNYARNFLNKLWNSARFIKQFWKGGIPKMPKTNHLIDLWILSLFQKVAKEYVEAMENYDFRRAISALHIFYWNNFCDYYIELTKERAYNGDESAINTLAYILYHSIKLFAPFIPHITEEIYNQLFAEGSIHLEKIEEKVWEGEDLTSFGEFLKKVIEEVRKEKTRKGLKLRDEVKEIKVSGEKDIIERLKQMKDELAKFLKANEIVFEEGEERIEVR